MGKAEKKIWEADFLCHWREKHGTVVKWELTLCILPMMLVQRNQQPHHKAIIGIKILVLWHVVYISRHDFKELLFPILIVHKRTISNRLLTLMKYTSYIDMSYTFSIPMSLCTHESFYLYLPLQIIPFPPTSSFPTILSFIFSCLENY